MVERKFVWATLSIASLASFIIIIDSFFLNVAITTLVRELHPAFSACSLTLLRNGGANLLDKREESPVPRAIRKISQQARRENGGRARGNVCYTQVSQGFNHGYQKASHRVESRWRISERRVKIRGQRTPKG
jgi:hypothetical protein